MKLEILFDNGKKATVNDPFIPNSIKKKLRKEFEKMTVEKKVITEPLTVYKER